LQLEDSTQSDMYYLVLQALSYRYECVLYRRTHRQKMRQQTAVENAKQRVHTSKMELDAITMKALASGKLQNFPVTL